MNNKPILVIGAGTTGLMLAGELVRHGAAVRIIDQLPEIVRTARATGMHSRTLEVMHDLGISSRLIERAAVIRGMNQYADKERILHFRYEGLDSPFPFSISLEQWKVEEELEQHLRNLGVEVERQTELVGLEQGDDGVIASLRHADGSIEPVLSPWLVGCDGAHSCVRHLQGEHFPGQADPRQYLVADVVLEAEHAEDEVFVYMSSHGVLWWFPLPDGRSLLAGDMPEQHDGTAETPGLEDVQAMIENRAPPGMQARDPRWMSWFHISYRLTPHYRHRRVFLAGDAAHIHSPVGGQGMNTGIQDAYNLGWKLALVAQGVAPESLLDSYEPERRAVAEDVLAMTRGLTEKAEQYVTMSPAQRAEAFRHVVLPDSERLKMLQHGEELDLDYRRSPACTEALQSGSEALEKETCPHAGAAAPDAGPLEVDGQARQFFDLLRGTHHTLLVVPQSTSVNQATAEQCINWAESIVSQYAGYVQACIVISESTACQPSRIPGVQVALDTEGALRKRYGGEEGRVYLVRPDGYIGHRCALDRPGDLAKHLDSVLTRPVG